MFDLVVRVELFVVLVMSYESIKTIIIVTRDVYCAIIFLKLTIT